jgi:hypothetical protein
MSDEPAVERFETPPESTAGRYTLKDVAKSRKRLKRSLADNSIFTYILMDFWKIRKFGRETGIIETSFPFRVKMAPGIGERLERSINQDIVIPLAARLEVILERAWLYLGKEEYNLIALLRSVCREAERVGYIKLNATQRFTHEAFRNLEPHFLVFYHRPKLLRRLLEVLNYTHDQMESVRFSFRETRQMTERLLMFDAVKPSLAQTVLAANMINCRRFLSMADLVEAVEEPLVSRLDYDVDERIHGEIYRYMDDVDKKLAGLYGSWVQLNSLRYFMPRLDPQTPDLTSLQRFITGKNGPERRGIYTDMYANIPSYVIDFSNRYIRTFETPLCRQPLIENQGPVQLFSPSIFAEYFSRLKYNLDQIERMRTQLPFFQILRYLELTKKNRRAAGYGEPANKLETQLLNYLDDHVRLFRSLKDELQRLAVVFAYPPERRETEVIEGTDNKGLPRGNSEILRHADRRMLSDGFTNGMTVQEAMTAAVSLINLYLYELHEGAVLAELEDDNKLRVSIRNLLQVAGRLANNEQVQRFRKKYPLDTD